MLDIKGLLKYQSSQLATSNALGFSNPESELEAIALLDQDIRKEASTLCREILNQPMPSYYSTSKSSLRSPSPKKAQAKQPYIDEPISAFETPVASSTTEATARDQQTIPSSSPNQTTSPKKST